MRQSCVGLASAFAVVLCSFAASKAQPYAFTTIAGQGVRGSNDGTNRTAQFRNCFGMVVDNQGSLFVVDTNNCTIRKVSHLGSDWVVSTIAGSPLTAGYIDGTNRGALFNCPAGIALDDAGNLYVADCQNQCIRKLTPAGTNWVVTTPIGSTNGPSGNGWADGTNNDARFFWLTGLTRDSAGNLYVTDTGNQIIRKVSPVGKDWVVTTIAGYHGSPRSGGYADGTNSDARFNEPMGIAVDSIGSLYVVDGGNATIRKITPVGTNWVVTTLLPRWSIGNPLCVAVDHAGTLFCTSPSQDIISRVTQQGTNWIADTVAGVIASPGTNDGVGADARFYGPQGITVDKGGNLYVADGWNCTIRLGWPALPTLQIVHSGNAAVLCWPFSATNFILETSPSPGASGSWSMYTGPVRSTQDGYVVTNLLNTGPAFFRLHQQ